METVTHDQQLSDPIQLVVRSVDGKRQLVICIRAGACAKETEERLLEAQKRYAHHGDDIHHIEVEQTQAIAAIKAAAEFRRVRRARRRA